MGFGLKHSKDELFFKPNIVYSEDIDGELS
jgi:hypothetical protein